MNKQRGYCPEGTILHKVTLSCSLGYLEVHALPYVKGLGKRVLNGLC